MSPPKTPVAVRIQQNSVEDAEGCWIWMLSTFPGGYGKIKADGQNRLAHRSSFVAFVGEIPEGMQIDHACHDPESCAGGPTCKHRRCVNPKHLRLASPRENVLRGNTIVAENLAKVRCPRGHEYDEGNTRLSASGRRVCLTCKRESDRIAKQAARDRAKALRMAG